MTRVDFYVLPAAGLTPEQLVCRLSHKAYDQGRQVYIHADTPEAVAKLDELLWTFRDIGFIPHKRAEQTEPPSAPVIIGASEPPGECADVMINLQTDVPPVFSRFERVIELVPADAAGKAAARARYRFYQERGYALETHEIN